MQNDGAVPLQPQCDDAVAQQPVVVMLTSVDAGQGDGDLPPSQHQPFRHLRRHSPKQCLSYLFHCVLDIGREFAVLGAREQYPCLEPRLMSLQHECALVHAAAPSEADRFL